MATYSLSALQTYVSSHQSDPFWIGVDVHKRNYHIALLRVDNKSLTFTKTASPDAFIDQLLRLDIPTAGVAYEVGTTSFGLARVMMLEDPLGQKRLRSLLIEVAWIWRAEDPRPANFTTNCWAKEECHKKRLRRWPGSWPSFSGD